jgi:DNA-binding NarL/FixJ family response regulator
MLRRAVHAIDRSLQGGQAWRQFETRFTQIFPGFFQHLTAINPALTSQDIKICAYHRMNLDTKEIASLCYLTVRAVQTSRYRLRKKLEIPEEMSFQEFINQI